MKGIIFTEFLELVEDKFGFSVVDKIIEQSELPSEGIYTAVGTYNYKEMVSLVMNLQKQTDIPAITLMEVFGEHLFSRLAKLYPVFLNGVEDPIKFLMSLEDYIHVEVKKLYPEAELPSFDTELQKPDQLKMTYHSVRCLYPVAEGLIKGCFKHFESEVQITKNMITESGNKVEFIINKL